MITNTCTSKLQKIGREKYTLTLKNLSKCQQRTNFQHISFHESEESLIAIDTKGIGYHLQYISTDWWVRKLGPIGQSTFVTFNPSEKTELIIGLTTSDIKFLNISDSSLKKFCLLQAHQVPPSWISFYKNYCLTASRKEAVIWDLKTARKIHQLRLEMRESSIRKALISSNGTIVALYENDTMQSWPLDCLDSEKRVSLIDHSVRNVKDFIFSENGRSLIVCGAKHRILIFSTKSWSLSVNFELPDVKSVARRLYLVPQDLNCGSKIVAILFEDRTLKFLDLSSRTFIPTSDIALEGVRKASISSGGQWLAIVNLDGSLIISSVDHLMAIKVKLSKRPLKPKQIKSHGIHDHLKCVRSEFRMELKSERLLPILGQFGQYPVQHRAVIWKTLLKLPENRDAFLTLSEKLMLETEREVLGEWKLADKSKEMILSAVIERLVQFCPLLGQTTFLPEFVFPFLVVFRKDPIAGFETILEILWNFCQKWFEYHPLPPINVLGIIENLLNEVDPILLEFYCQNGITSSEYAWPLLKTNFSEVLAGNEWLILWDHLITMRKPSMLIFCVISYSVCNREAILGVLKGKEDFVTFFSIQGNVSARKIIKMAEKMYREVSNANHPKRYLRDKWKFLPATGPYPPFLLKEYPKFLIGDLGNVKQLMGMRQEELMLKEHRKQLARELDEKRLKEETENFLKEIHRQRIHELQKCYNEQVKLMKINLDTERHKLTEVSSENFLHSTKDVKIQMGKIKKSDKKGVRKKSIKQVNPCEKLREDVDILAENVQTFLESIRSTR